MMWEFSDCLLGPLPCLIKRFTTKLSEVSDVIPQYAILASGQNLLKNLDERSAQVVMDSYGSELNQALALSFSEIRKSCNLMALSETLLNFTVL